MTEEQEFWEKCGFELREMKKLGTIHFTDKSKKPEDFYDSAGWTDPSGNAHIGMPDITLDNLFKYAVPKLPFLRMDYQPITGEYFFETMKLNDPNLKVGKDKDPAIALYKALREVLC